MAEVQTTEFFIDGEVVDAARLNRIIQLATILETLITNKSPITASANDYLLVWDDLSTDLKKSKVADLPVSVNSVELSSAFPGLSVTPAGPRTGVVDHTIAIQTQSGNKFLASPANGLLGAPLWRQAVTLDEAITTVTIPAFAIDCSLSRTFYKVLGTGANNFSIANVQNGQEPIYVLLQQQAPTGGGTVLFGPSIRWPGGTNPVMSTQPGRLDLFEFITIVGTLHGRVVGQNYAL